MIDYEGLRGILDRLPTGVFLVSREGEIPLHNAKVPEMLGVDALDLMERGIAAVPEDTGIPGAWRTLRDEERREQTLELSRGGRRLSAALIQGEHALFGERCLLALVSDVSERERLRELRDGVIKELLRRARGPLTSVKTALALLSSPEHASLPPAAKEVVQLGDAEIRRLHRLLGDMSELLVLESPSAATGLYMENVELGALLRKCARAAAKTPAGLGRDILLPGPGAADAFVVADLDKLRLVIDHLLANALAYSGSGLPVRVSWSAGEQRAEIRVEDEGIGIAPGERPGLFGKFFRGGRPEVLAREGSGLGLFISRAYAELMGGALVLEDRPGRGTVAVLTLPAPARATAWEWGA